MHEPESLRTLVVDDTAYETRYTGKFAARRAYTGGNPREVVARIPGVIQRLYVGRGDAVRRGDPLLVLEAMKMANDVTSPRDGKVGAIHCEVGKMVAKGQVLIELE